MASKDGQDSIAAAEKKTESDAVQYKIADDFITLDISDLKSNRQLSSVASSDSGEAACYSSKDDTVSRSTTSLSGSTRSRTSNGSVVSSEKTDLIWVEDVNNGRQELNTGSDISPHSIRSRNNGGGCDTKETQKGPLKLLQKLRRKSLSKIVGVESVGNQVAMSDYSNVRVDELPQTFIAKYLGSKSTRGNHGMKHVRSQIDTLVEEAAKKQSKDIPVAQVTIWEKGIQINAHPQSRNKNVDQCVRPIEFVSFCVQDVNYYKIIAFIYITEMSKSMRRAECHVYICDSPCSARKMALSVALAFKMYSKRLGDKCPNSLVDLKATEQPVQVEDENSDSDA